jgi:hypothetical protein
MIVPRVENVQRSADQSVATTGHLAESVPRSADRSVATTGHLVESARHLAGDSVRIGRSFHQVNVTIVEERTNEAANAAPCVIGLAEPDPQDHVTAAQPTASVVTRQRTSEHAARAATKTCADV